MRPITEVDLECYSSYFLAKFYLGDGSYKSFGMWPGMPLNISGIVELLASHTIITFNGINYDVLMLTVALYGATNEQLKEANDDIIVRKLRPWEFCDKWGIQIPDYLDHIDVMEVAPGVRIGLKMYMGRMHAPKLQDLPYDPDSALDGYGRFVIADYCGNDLVGTRMLRETVADRIALRVAISQQYGIDVRSKSDAQIAEAVIKASLGFKPNRRYIEHGYSFKYEPPAYIRYVTPQMQQFLDVVRNAAFVITDKEEAIYMGLDPTDIRTGVNIPAELKDRDIIIGQGVYRMGIGGLHSQEQCAAHYSIAGVQTLRDVDVKSYYPSLILTMGMVPQQIGPDFLTIYGDVYKRRLHAKSESDRIMRLYDGMGAQELKDEADRLKTESDGLKIVLNGTFGKLFSKYSILYAPELGIRTTVTGQLALLMLIEMMECSGVRVVSANTDGIVLLIPNGMDALADQIVQWWERTTGLEMEASFYRSIHQRDVNNYVAITTDGKAKRKGVFGQGGVLSGPAGKGPDKDICGDAAVAYWKDGIDPADTIRACTDIRKFIVLRGVSGGGSYMPDGQTTANPEYLGKAVRWYYAMSHQGYIADKKGGRVAGSLGAKPVMQLPDSLPSDIDYAHYINVTWEMLADAGTKVRYWVHSESGSYFITNAQGDGADPSCDEIDRKTYDKRK